MNQETFKQILTTQIPIAWIAGVRLESFKKDEVITYVEFDFLNQNPFQSMFWAVQGMAAEFSGGLMLLTKIKMSGQNIASLVVKNEMEFTKKAVGKITFTCDEGQKIDEAIQRAIETKEGVVIPLTTIAKDEQGDVVAKFLFTWSIKARG
ncbi:MULTISPECIES: DUF4442 domain-containing protein [Myroides]|uniref:DUF4442 domain-containing protein n=1 Tax=Myroides albus TaxID=2562892 RepID=A0A6I3LL34_9FLAO|nr:MULTISPECIES: DUF4442 domain-containing protein [Myroides]MTG98437.1 DUF4442 domain-containing protein [Myroides albus]MVX35043.1 DUF4442 domain-containing protein [Myroides sp. LoEW2-1]UVD79650.1 DUF4442 domain-containing protein [Myroides albus]